MSLGAIRLVCSCKLFMLNRGASVPGIPIFPIATGKARTMDVRFVCPPLERASKRLTWVQAGRDLPVQLGEPVGLGIEGESNPGLVACVLAEPACETGIVEHFRDRIL
jgi:hypothetical protein